jgi:hypothetical protein
MARFSWCVALASIAAVACSSPSSELRPHTCTAPEVACGSACADLQTSEAHCGACGTACTASQLCDAGVCVAGPPPSCTAPWGFCGPTCVNLDTDEAHCGTCDTACTGSDVCVAGACLPPCPVEAPSRCGAACVSLTTDELHCGTCTTVCGAAQRCSSAVCQGCPAFQSFCDPDLCVAPGTDELNCGACGTACGIGETCTLGSCVPACSGTLGWPSEALAFGQWAWGSFGSTSDLDGDGLLDLVFAGSYGVEVLEGLGGGKFAAAIRYLDGIAVQDLVVADLDGDGRAEIAVSVDTTDLHGVVVLPNDGAGNLGAPVAYDSTPAPGVGSAQPRGLVAADLDGDTDLDLALAHYSTYQVAIFVNDGTGTLSGPTTFTTGLSGSEWLAAADFTGDGKIDLAAEYYSTIRILPNVGGAAFGAAVSYPPASAGWYFMSLDRIRAGDMDGDGRPDLLVREYDGTLRIAWNAATNRFSTKTDLVLTGRAADMAIADVNGDAALDILAALEDNGTADDDQALGVALNTGSRTFGAPRAFPVGGSGSTLAVGDGDGDGILDAAVARGSEGTWLPGVGDGTFVSSVRTTLPLDQDVTRSLVADLNGDGLGDLVMSTWRGQSVGWALSNGDGTFGAFTFVPGGPYVYELAVGDLNGDGRPEILTSNNGDATTGAGAGVSVYVNQGDGTFAPRVTYAFANADGLAVGDLNEDGKLDVVTYNYNWQVAFLLGNGDGTLQAAVPFSFGTYVIAGLRVGDMDGDGRNDPSCRPSGARSTG